MSDSYKHLSLLRHNDESRYVECHCADCFYSKCHGDVGLASSNAEDLLIFCKNSINKFFNEKNNIENLEIESTFSGVDKREQKV